MFSGILDYQAFLISALVFAITPGLDTAFVLNKALGTGRKAALAGACGVNAGILVHTAVGALGLSAVLATSAQAFAVIKYAGAAYLVYLGIRALMAKSDTARFVHGAPQAESVFKSFEAGLIANVLNPKVALFVLAFFPQFIDPTYAAGPRPFLVLGVSYAAVGLIWYLCLAWFAGGLGETLRQKPMFETWMNRASGIVFILLGAKIAMTER